MAHGPNILRPAPAPPEEECPYCGREAVLRHVRLDWPNPPGPDDITAPMCRLCEEAYRAVLRDFGHSYFKDGHSGITLHHAPTLAQRKAMVA